MKSLKADQFFKIAVLLGRISEFLRTGANAVEKVKSKTKLTDKDKQSLDVTVVAIRDQAEEVDAKITVIAATDLLQTLESADATWANLREGVQDIEATFRREASTMAMYAIESDLRGLTDACDAAFGAEFQTKFPSALYDLEEACHCLAMGRSTATAFHLMRIMEILLRSIHACLGLSPPTGADKNWGNMLQAIKVNMTARNANANSGWNGKDRAFFQDLYASIDAVRVAWRNTTMHVEQRYDKDESQHLFHVVKALSKKLAERCDELGTPIA